MFLFVTNGLVDWQSHKAQGNSWPQDSKLAIPAWCCCLCNSIWNPERITTARIEEIFLPFQISVQRGGCDYCEAPTRVRTKCYLHVCCYSEWHNINKDNNGVFEDWPFLLAKSHAARAPFFTILADETTDVSNHRTALNINPICWSKLWHTWRIAWICTLGADDRWTSCGNVDTRGAPTVVISSTKLQRLRVWWSI